jgi:3-hydroxyisobutyrate dehydrogenase
MALAVGFIGLGVMGQPMALNLLRAGFPLTVYNRTLARCDPLVAAGAQVAASPAEVARASAVVITMLSDSPDVEQVVLGTEGVAAGAQPGAVVVDMSTISPRVTRAIASRLEAQQVALVDAPVSGGEAGAQAGTLSILVGGSVAAVSIVQPVLAELGKRITHLGPSGAGQTAKLCNQIVGMLNLLAASEGLLFAARNGLDLEQVLEAVGAGAAGSWQWSNSGASMVRRNFAPGFRVALALKDLRLALENAAELNLPLLATSQLVALFRSLQAHGQGELGVQALVLALENLAGFSLAGERLDSVGRHEAGTV